MYFLWLWSVVWTNCPRENCFIIRYYPFLMTMVLWRLATYICRNDNCVFFACGGFSGHFETTAAGHEGRYGGYCFGERIIVCEHVLEFAESLELGVCISLFNRKSHLITYFIWLTEAVVPDVFYKKGVFKNFAKFIEKHRWQSLFFNKVAGNSCNFIKNETLAQVFSCKFCEISKNIFFTEHLRWLLLVKFILKLTIT